MISLPKANWDVLGANYNYCNFCPCLSRPLGEYYMSKDTHAFGVMCSEHNTNYYNSCWEQKKQNLNMTNFLIIPITVVSSTSGASKKFFILSNKFQSIKRVDEK